MKRVGIIDIGSNSMRLVVVEFGRKRSFRIFDELKETVRLADELDQTGELQVTRMEKAIDALKMFKNLCDSVEVDEVIAIGTAAVRKAKNREVFLNRVKEAIGVDVRILSGEEEAFYAYWGVINSIDIQDGLIMDIGGGSTELIWVKDREICESVSLPFGAITLTEQFQLENNVKDEQEKALRQFLRDKYQSVPWLKHGVHQCLVGVGGTFRNIGKIDRDQKTYPLDITHNYRLTSTNLQKIYELVRGKNLAQRKKVSGLSKERADIFVGATAAIVTLLEVTGIQELVVSGSGIREGLIYEQLCPDRQPVTDVLDFSINNLMTKFNINHQHSSHIYHLTRTLFERLRELHGITEDIERILRAAAFLHDCGIQIRYYNHHEHSFYIILNSAINGLTHRELLMSAAIAASHRKDPFQYNWVRYQGIITKEDQEIVQKVGVLLRLAESFDRGMTGVVKDLRCEIFDDTVIIHTIADENPELAVYNALGANKQFKKVYKKDLLIN